MVRRPLCVYEPRDPEGFVPFALRVAPAPWPWPKSERRGVRASEPAVTGGELTCARSVCTSGIVGRVTVPMSARSPAQLAAELETKQEHTRAWYGRRRRRRPGSPVQRRAPVRRRPTPTEAAAPALWSGGSSLREQPARVSGLPLVPRPQPVSGPSVGPCQADTVSTSRYR